MILKPKGYFIEHYNKDLELVSEYNYKLKGPDFIQGYFKNGQLYLLFLDYNLETLSYDYVVHRSPISDFNFTNIYLTFPGCIKGKYIRSTVIMAGRGCNSFPYSSL